MKEYNQAIISNTGKKQSFHGIILIILNRDSMLLNASYKKTCF